MPLSHGAEQDEGQHSADTQLASSDVAGTDESARPDLSPRPASVPIGVGNGTSGIGNTGANSTLAHTRSGWQRFTQKVVSAAGSFNPGSLQIPQRLLHLANSMALECRSRELASARGRPIGPDFVFTSEFVKHDGDSAASAVRYLVLGKRYAEGADDVQAAIARHALDLSTSAAKPDPDDDDHSDDDELDPVGCTPSRQGQQAVQRRIQHREYMTSSELAKVLVNREGTINPHRQGMVQLTGGEGFGLLRPESDDNAGQCRGRNSAESLDRSVHSLRLPAEVRPFARFPADVAGASMAAVLAEQWGLDLPRVLVAVVGDRRVPSRLSTEDQLRLEDVISDVAYSDSVWFLTTGWELGLAGLIGRFVADAPNPVAVIGVSAWELLDPANMPSHVTKRPSDAEWKESSGGVPSSPRSPHTLLGDCGGRLRAVPMEQQESHRRSRASTSASETALKHSLAFQHTHHLFVDTPSPDSPKAPESPVQFDRRARESERAAILRLIAELAPPIGPTDRETRPRWASFGSFGVLAPMVPLAFVCSGGLNTLRDCAGYVAAGVPLVVVDGVLGASAVIAKRYTLAQMTDDGADPAEMARLQQEYDALCADSFVDEGIEQARLVRGTVKAIVDAARAAETSRGAPMVFIGSLDADRPEDRPGGALLRAKLSHPAYKVDDRAIDEPLESDAARWSHRARRAARLEVALKWKLLTSPEQKASEFRRFRFLPTLSTDDAGKPRDSMLETQVAMIKYLLMDYGAGGSELARRVLEQITDLSLRTLFSYVPMPAVVLGEATESLSEDAEGFRIRHLHSLTEKARLARRRATGRARVELIVRSTDREASGLARKPDIRGHVPFPVVLGFDESDYSLPVHLGKASVLHDVTDCVAAAFTAKLRLQMQRQNSSDSASDGFRVRHHDDPRYRRDLAGVATTLIKFFLANGFLLCEKPVEKRFVDHVGLLPPAPSDRLLFPGHSAFHQTEAKNAQAVAPRPHIWDLLGFVAQVFGLDAAWTSSKCGYEVEGSRCGQPLALRKWWCIRHACPLCRHNSKPASSPACDECKTEEAARQSSFRYLRDRLAAYRYTQWRDRKIYAEPKWEPGEEYTGWFDGQPRALDPTKRWTHPGLNEDVGLKDTLCFHAWYAEEVLCQLLKRFCIYRTSTMEDLYSFGGDTDASRRQLSHMSVLFPEGLFTSSFVCHRVERWLGVEEVHRGLLQQHELGDPFFALFIWALLTNRLQIAVTMLCKRPGEIAVNALVGAKICSHIIHELQGGTSEVEVAPAIEIEFIEFKKKLLRIADCVLHRAYLADSEKAVHALQSPFPQSGGIELWQLAYSVHAGKICAGPAMRAVVEREWWGNVDRTNGVVKILITILTFGLYALVWTSHDAFDYRTGRPPLARNLFYMPLRVTVARGDDGRLAGGLVTGSGTTLTHNAPGDGSAKSWATIGIRRVHRFFCSPQITFYVEVLFWVMYLLIFSYASLLTPQPWITIFKLATIDDVAQISALGFVIAHILDEAEQAVLCVSEWSLNGVWHGILRWWKSDLNKWDTFTYFVIVPGLALKVSTRDLELQTSKLLLAIGALQLWLRSMQFFAKSAYLGPQTVALSRMGNDVKTFSVLLATSLFGSGVAMYSIAQPWRGIDEGTPIDLLFKPTFRVFGELFLEETFEDTGCLSADSAGWRSCQLNWYITIALVVLFVFFSNIVLVNQLIAAMSHTYDGVKDRATEHWAIQNVDLLFALRNGLPTAPPLNLLYYALWGGYFVVTSLSRMCVRQSGAGAHKTHPMPTQDTQRQQRATQDQLARRRRDLLSRDKIVAFLEPHGIAAVRELGMLDGHADESAD